MADTPLIPSPQSTQAANIQTTPGQNGVSGSNPNYSFQSNVGTSSSAVDQSPASTNISSSVLNPQSSVNVPPPPSPTNGLAENASIPSPTSIVNNAYQPTAAEGQQSDLLKQIANLIGNSPSAATYTYNAEQAAGIPQMAKTVNDLTTQLSGLNDQATYLSQIAPTTIQNQAEQSATGRGMTTGGLQPITASQLRENQIKQAGIAAQALTVKSALYAAQGNLTLAQAAADKAAQVKFDAQQQQLNGLKTQLDAIAPQLSKDQAQRADILKQQLADRQNQIDIAKAQFTAVQGVIADAAKAGADSATLQAMGNAQTAGQAYQIAQKAGIPMSAPGRYKDSITTMTDPFGNQFQRVRVFDTLTGKFVDNAPAGGADALNAPLQSFGSVASGTEGAGGTATSTASSPHGLSFEQYGLLAKTDFNPNAGGNAGLIDRLAQKYLDAYVKKGALPSTRDIGLGMNKQATALMGEVSNRAQDLYFKATGQPLPNPEIIGGYQKQLIGNNNLLNNLKVQEGTIRANSQLLINNMNAGNVNKALPFLNGLIDTVRNATGDPNTAAFVAQNSTLQSELGALLALKNAQGTTVHDKLAAAGLVAQNATPTQDAAVVKQLMQEASNATSAVDGASGELYKQIDPLMQDANNPQRQIETAFAKQGGSYNDFIQKTPSGQIPILIKSTGQLAYVPIEEFDPSLYRKI